MSAKEKSMWGPAGPVLIRYEKAACPSWIEAKAPSLLLHP